MTAPADAVVSGVLVWIVRRSVTVLALGCSVLGNFTPPPPYIFGIHFLAWLSFHGLLREQDQRFDQKTWREIYNLCRSWNKFKENAKKKKNEDIVTMEEPKCDEALSPEDNSEDTIERSSLG